MEMRSLLWRRHDVIVDGREIDCFFFDGIGGERSGESEIDGRAIRSVESGRGRDAENRSSWMISSYPANVQMEPLFQQ